MKMLNAFAGAGGNRDRLTGLDITAIDYNPFLASEYALRYPDDTVLVGDAYKYIMYHYNEFDIIWASPPCQSHSRAGRAKRKQPVYPDFRMLELIVFLHDNFNGNWVIENVTPYWNNYLIFQNFAPRQIFKSRIGRHSFWSNIMLFENISLPDSKGPITWNGSKESYKEYEKRIQEYLGIKLSRRILIKTEYDSSKRPGAVYRNMVHPLIGEYIVKQLIKQEKTIMDYVT